jgi:hypothetical protein
LDVVLAAVENELLGGIVDDQRETFDSRRSRGRPQGAARSPVSAAVAGHRGTHPGERERADGCKHR